MITTVILIIRQKAIMIVTYRDKTGRNSQNDSNNDDGTVTKYSFKKMSEHPPCSPYLLLDKSRMVRSFSIFSPDILLIKFLLKYKHLNFSNFSKFSISEKPLLSSHIALQSVREGGVGGWEDCHHEDDYDDYQDHRYLQKDDLYNDNYNFDTTIIIMMITITMKSILIVVMLALMIMKMWIILISITAVE